MTKKEMCIQKLNEKIDETFCSSRNGTLCIVTIPCFSGAPWDLEKLVPLSKLPLKTMRLPEGLDTIEAYADFVEEQIKTLECFVLVGDSFGAVIALAFATRRPSDLFALIMSGGFAANPIKNRLMKARVKPARFLPGLFYKKVTLRMHAASLASPYDAEGQVPWSKEKSRKLFDQNTPFRSYVARSRAAFGADYRDRLSKINVPTLIITPSYDKLIGREAAIDMLENIPEASEIVLEKTGHMFRFSHPKLYAETILNFLEQQFGDNLQFACR